MSAFDLTNSKAINNNYKIVYNFFANDVNKSDIQYDPYNPYLTVTFPNNQVTPNLLLTIPNVVNSWQTTSISIYSLLHNNIQKLTDVPDSDFIGELVVKLNSTSTSSSTYVCFLLQTNPDSNAPANDVDNFMFLYANPNSVSGTITLNHSIPKQKRAIYYRDVRSDSHVIVFTTPISVNQVSTMFIENSITSMGAPFSVNAPPNKAYSVITSITELNEDQIYISCNPTGESDETLQTYNVPINSEYTSAKQQIDYMKMTVNFFLFFLGLLFSYFFIPTIYKVIAIDQSIRFHHAYGEPNYPSFMIRLRTIDYFISFLFFLAVLILAIIGFQKSNYYLVTMGLFLAVFYGLSWVIIQNKKMTPEWKTPLKEYSHDELIYNPSRNYNKPSDYFIFVGQVFIFLFYRMPYLAAVISLYIIGLIFYCLFISGQWKETFTYAFTSYYIYVVLIAILAIQVAVIKPDEKEVKSTSNMFSSFFASKPSSPTFGK